MLSRAWLIGIARHKLAGHWRRQAGLRELASVAVPVQRPYGLTAECIDDQGMRFYLGE
jgi:DNA-directed RNA polymerase specialized sigma24 family protein